MSVDSMTKNRRGPLVIVCAFGRKVTGQSAASELVFKLLVGVGKPVKMHRLPALDRDGGEGSVRYLLRLLGGWMAMVPSIAKRRRPLVNLGQTRSGMVRDGVPLRLLRLASGRKGIISLHGNVIRSWSADQREARMLRSLVKHARFVTVLGPGQVECLAGLGIPREKVVILPNAIELTPATPEEIQIKHIYTDKRPLEILYLSNLIESKGFPEFLKAMVVLAARTDCPAFNATLCGPVMKSEFSNGELTPDRILNLIEESITTVNATGRGTLRWIKGAYGAEKEAMLRKTHLLVFPTRYAVEAQPLVLLEAMCTGAVIVTSAVGEIRSTVEDTGVCLDDPTVENLAAAVMPLLKDGERRLTLALKALSRFSENYTAPIHLQAWERLLEAED